MCFKLFPPSVFLGYITSSMVRSLFLEKLIVSLVCQEVVRVLCNPDVTFITVFTRIRPLIVSVLNCSSHCCCLTPSFFKIHFNSVLPSTPWSSKRFFPSILPTKTPYSFTQLLHQPLHIYNIFTLKH